MADAFGFGTPFEAQLAFFRAKLNVPTQVWDDITRAAHDRAFIVAGAAKADLLKDLRQAVDRTMAAGGSVAEFRQQFRAVVAKNGWTGWTGEGSAKGEAWRALTIYRTNMATSYAAGRYRQLTDPTFVALRPFWRYHHADGVAHPRPLHLSWNGLTLRHDHDFWRTHFAPNGWGCHCWISAEAVPAQGVATEPPAGWEEIDPKTGAQVGIDRGFDYAPGANVDTALRVMVQDKLITYPPAIGKALSADVNRYLNAVDRPARFARRALDTPTMEEVLWLGFVSDAERLRAQAAVQADHFTITLPASTVRHVFKSHRHDGKGQRAATEADYDQVAEVLNQADTLRQGDGANVVAVKKLGEETFRAVFQVLSGKRNRSLALLSLVIKTAHA